MDAIPLMGRTTRIDKALRMAQKELFKEVNGGRSDVQDLLILLTDGTQTPGSDAEEPGLYYLIFLLSRVKLTRKDS